MASIDANITIDLPDGVNFQEYIMMIQQQLTQLNGLETKISVNEVDDPMSLSPIRLSKWGKE